MTTAAANSKQPFTSSNTHLLHITDHHLHRTPANIQPAWWLTGYCIILRPHCRWSLWQREESSVIVVCWQMLSDHSGNSKVVKRNQSEGSFWMQILTIWPHKQIPDAHWSIFYSHFLRASNSRLLLIVHRYWHTQQNATHLALVLFSGAATCEYAESSRVIAGCYI